MNVREEDRQKTNCPGRGLGIAAAAIGVGVGAALYYFFSKRPENPHGEGSTSEGWSCEQPHTPSEEEQIAFLTQEAFREQEQLMLRRQQNFRERTWSLEECSICFEIILKDQDVTSLPCTHHFHTDCIMPWLQEQQTCPNCRKAAE